MYGARAEMQAVGHFIETERGGQCGAQQVADTDDHFAVAPVEQGNLVRCAVEKAGQGGFVTAGWEVEQVGVERRDQYRCRPARSVRSASPR